MYLPMSGKGSTISQLGTDLRNMATCCMAFSRTKTYGTLWVIPISSELNETSSNLESFLLFSLNFVFCCCFFCFFLSKNNRIKTLPQEIPVLQSYSTVYIYIVHWIHGFSESQQECLWYLQGCYYMYMYVWNSKGERLSSEDEACWGSNMNGWMLLCDSISKSERESSLFAVSVQLSLLSGSSWSDIFV